MSSWQLKQIMCFFPKLLPPCKSLQIDRCRAKVCWVKYVRGNSSSNCKVTGMCTEQWAHSVNKCQSDSMMCFMSVTHVQCDIMLMAAFLAWQCNQYSIALHQWNNTSHVIDPGASAACISTRYDIRPWPLTLKTFSPSNAYSYEEYLCQVSCKSLH